MQTKHFLLSIIFLLLTPITSNQNLLKAARTMSLTSHKCPKEIMEYYLPKTSLKNSELITPELSSYCPNMRSTCCIKSDFEYLLTKFKEGQTMMINIQNSFKEVFENFHTQRRNGFKKMIEITNEELLAKCKEETKLNDLEELLKEAEEIEEVAMGKLKSMKNRNDLYYAGFPCNICNGTLGNYFNFDEETQNDKLILSSSDLKFTFRTYEVYFDILAAFEMISDVARINLCLNQEDSSDLIFNDKMLQQISEGIEHCRPIIEDAELGTDYKSKEMLPCLRLVVQAGFLGNNEVFEAIGNNLDKINYGISLNQENPQPKEFGLKDKSVIFFPNLGKDKIRPHISFSDDKNVWDSLSNSLDIKKWTEQKPNDNFVFFLGMKMMIFIFVIFF